MNKQCSRAELEKVMLIIEEGTFLKEWEYALTQDANEIIAAKDDIVTQNETILLNLHDRIIASVNDEYRTVPLKVTRVNWKLISMAAAAVIILLSGWWLLIHQNSNLNAVKEQIVYESDVAPGKAGATLVLGNGKSIILNGSKTGMVIKGNKLNYNDGTEVGLPAAPAEKELYTAVTAVGNMYMLTLPDGTLVWLNAASRLTFPSRFNSGSRVVNLQGEAFFKVAKDKSQPFIVETKGQQVKVLGTHFNISSYADEQSTKTTLIEGSVEINSAKNNVIIKPGQQSTRSSNGTLTVTDVDTTLAMAWKNNKFIFENNNIESVMRMVQRWYNVEIIYSGPLPDAAFGGKVSRFNNVSSVLRVLEITGGAHFKIEGRKIYVSK